MAAYAHQYHHFQEQPHFVDPSTYPFGHYNVREKTPTDSLLNHTGLSPGPLTATPPLSRDPSRQPELHQDQQPELLPWDNGSFSDSPTSVRTPDGDSFEYEMLDSTPAMQNFYQQTGFNMSTQVSNNTIPATEAGAVFTSHGTFTNNIIDAEFNAALAAQSQHTYPQQHHVQPIQTNSYAPNQFQQQTFGSNYTTQPLRQDPPWNGQGPSRSSMEPRSGGVIFDAVTDPVDYGNFVTMSDVQNWAMHYNPSMTVSPNTMSPQDNFFNIGQQSLPHRPQVQIPPNQYPNQGRVEMQVTPASPRPDAQNFVNLTTESSFFTESYTTGSNYSPSSPGNSSIGHFPQSPFQPTISPAAVSPSSESFFPSFQQADDVMMMDHTPTQQFYHAQTQPGATITMSYPSVKGKEVAFDLSPEPEGSAGATMRITGKSGGRQLGTHLEPTVAKAAHDMRKITACWHCVLQRDRCGPGDVCERCLKRSQRPNADCGLGCSRIKLVDLTTYFLPGLVTQMHEDSHLKHFVSQYIHQWGSTELTVYMTCGQHSMPRMAVKVYEFVARGQELLVQLQYITNPKTKQREVVRKQSPALGMVHINHNEEKTYDKYISDIVDNHLDAFGELCWKEDDNDFLQKLFKLMSRVKPKSEDESKLLREVFRLVVVTFIMSHTLTIAEETKHSTLSRMHSYGGAAQYYENFTSPRMTNRQLKYFFSRLQKSIQTTVLNKLQQIFKSSKGCDKWLAAFVAVLGMCMALEDQQKTIHQVMATRAATDGTDPRDAQAQADIACQEIDNRAHFVQQIFRWKYNRKHNPLVNADHDWEKEAGFGDASSVSFVRQVAQLVKENTDFLQQQQRVSISYKNAPKYSSRLVGQFLLSFWLPNA